MSGRGTRKRRRDEACICTTCWNLRRFGAHVDDCSCIAREHSTVGAAEASIPCRTCRVCALEVLNGHTRWSKLLCQLCCDRAGRINGTAGRCVIPIGIHSLMNGVSIEAAALVGGTEAEIRILAFADQLQANLGGISALDDWGRNTVRQRCQRFGRTEPELIEFSRYRQACRRAGITVESSWASLLDALENTDR